MFIPFSGSPSAVYGLPCGSRPSDDTKAQVPKSEAPRPGGPQAPRGRRRPGRSRCLRAETAGPRGPGAPPPLRRRQRTLAEEGGDVTACLFLLADNKVAKFERGGKKPTPLGSPSCGGLQSGWSSRGPALAEAWRPRGRAGMGVTVEVHQVYKYPFEQVVASFLRKVPARLRSGAPVLPRLLRRQLSARLAPASAAVPPSPVPASPSPRPLFSPLVLFIPRVPSRSPLRSPRQSPHPPSPLPLRCCLRAVLGEGGGFLEGSPLRPRGGSVRGLTFTLCCSGGRDLWGGLRETQVPGPRVCWVGLVVFLEHQGPLKSERGSPKPSS